MLVIDIGNTTTRLARWDGSTYHPRLALPTGTSGPDGRALGLWLVESGMREERAAIASVVAAATESVTAALTAAGAAPPLTLAYPQHRFMAHALETPETTGIDRLCAAWAAWHDARGAAVVADVGSAITVDAVSADGVFLGGTIQPGVASSLRGLAAAAPALPDLAATWQDRVAAGGRRLSSLGRDTASAMLAGALYGLVGSVERLAAEHRAFLGCAAPLYLTGGDAPHLLPFLQEEPRCAPDLVLDGIRLAAETVRDADCL